MLRLNDHELFVAALLRDRLRHEPQAGGGFPRLLLPALRQAARRDGDRHRLRHGAASDSPRAARLSDVGPRSLAREHRLPARARGRGRSRRAPPCGRHDTLHLALARGRGHLHARLPGPPAHERGDPRPPPLCRPRRQEGRALRLRSLHVLVVDRSRPTLVLDAHARAGDGASHLRGAQGLESGDPDLLRGHGAGGARERGAPRVPPAPRLAHGVPAGAPRPRRAGGRLRARGVVLRIQAAPQARSRPPPAADGGGPPQAVAPGDERRAVTPPWPGSFSGAGPSCGCARGILGFTARRSPISRASRELARRWTWSTRAAGSWAVAFTIRVLRCAVASSPVATRRSTQSSLSAVSKLPGSTGARRAL